MRGIMRADHEAKIKALQEQQKRCVAMELSAPKKAKSAEKPTSSARQQEHEKEVESQIEKLLGERDFAGAAALQEEAKRRAAQEKDEDFEADLARLLARRDYAGAAALQAKKSFTH